MSKAIFESTILPHIGKTAKYAGYCFNTVFQKNNIDLSKEQWLVLKMLHDTDGQVQNDLAFISNRSKTSLTRLINTIEKKGYVIRITSKKDKRINHIFLTKEGKVIFKKSLPALQNLIGKLQKGINPEDLKLTIKVLQQIQNNIIKYNSLLNNIIK